MLSQEDYFNNIFNTVREAILILDENMRVLSANRSFFKIFKVDSTNTIGFFLYDLGKGQWNIPDLRVLLEDVLPKNDTVDDYEIEYNFESIGHKTMLLNARKIREKNNGLPIILLVIEDFTERREIEKGLEKARKELKGRANELETSNQLLQEKITGLKLSEESLLESQKKYQTLMDESIDAIFITDTKGNLVEVNTKAEQLTRYSKEELLGMHFMKLHPLEVQEEAGAAFMKGLLEGAANYMELPLIRKDGETIYVDLVGKFIQCSDRTLGQAIVRDITERKRVEADLEAKNIALRIVLEHLEIEKNILHTNLKTNIETLIMPILKILQTRRIFPEYINLLQRNIEELASSFGIKISDPGLSLSPKEIEICAMIKVGYTNKEIAAFLNSSVQTVEKHRKNIRKKLDIVHKKINLNIHLQHL